MTRAARSTRFDGALLHETRPGGTDLSCAFVKDAALSCSSEDDSGAFVGTFERLGLAERPQPELGQFDGLALR